MDRQAALILTQGAAAVAWNALETVTPVQWTPLPPLQAGEVEAVSDVCPGR